MSFAASFVLGGFVFSFIEYAHHRYGGHSGAMGSRIRASHKAHHRDPMEGGVTYPTKLRQRIPLVALGSAIVGLIALPAGVIHSACVTGGAIAAYAYSEWFHHRMHHRAPRNRFERWMWRYHYVHHFRDPRTNYGFTSPLWDFVLGTARVERSVRVPASRIPEWNEAIPGFEPYEPR